MSHRIKCIFLNYETIMVRPTLIDLNPAELKNHPVRITFDKCTKIFNVLCFLKETKDVNVTKFHMITNRNEAKAMTEHISYDCKCKFNSIICNSNKK